MVVAGGGGWFRGCADVLTPGDYFHPTYYIDNKLYVND